LTANLIENALKIGGVEKLAPRRIFHELQLILSEENPLLIIRRLAEFKLLQALDPEMVLTPKTEAFLEEIRNILSWFDLLYLNEPCRPWLVYFLALTQPLNDLSTLRQRLGLPRKVVELIKMARTDGEKALNYLNRHPRVSRNEIYQRLSPLDNEVLLYLMAKTNQETTRKAVSLYFTKLKAIRVAIGGDDLKGLGLLPGPQFKAILSELLEARINEKVLTRNDEIAYVRERYLNSPEPILP
jgi:tRNA nucleotidyltransferase (CCA-adding enzyme)